MACTTRVVTCRSGLKPALCRGGESRGVFFLLQCTLSNSKLRLAGHYYTNVNETSDDFTHLCI